MDKFPEFESKFIVISSQGVAAICKACPATVSAKSSSELGSMLRAHFEKNHKKKQGMIYCETCVKSICNVGQQQQLEVHMSSSAHQGKTCRKGAHFRACATCAAVSPPTSHNPAHTIANYEYAAAEVVAVGEREFAERILSVSTKLTSTGDVSIGSWCNEHFEKLFECDFDHCPLTLTKGAEVTCSVCKRLSVIWPKFKVRRGPKCAVAEVQLRKYVVGQIDVEVDREYVLTPIEFGQLSDEEQELYDYNPNQRMFVLRQQAAKKQVIREFMANGARGGQDEDQSEEEEEEAPQLVDEDRLG